jgi:FlaA1/EpsC-like NDP-sugar epimerase
MIRRHIYWLCSIAAAALSLTAAFLLRFDFAVPAREWEHLQRDLAIFIAIQILTFYLWATRYSLSAAPSVLEVVHLSGECSVATVSAGIATALIAGPIFPRSIYVLDGIFFFVLMTATLFSRRIYREITREGAHLPDQKPILIYGAGAAGLMLARELRANHRLGYRAVGFLDDDRGQRGMSISGIPVVGRGRDAARIVLLLAKLKKPIAEIVIAMPSASGSEMRAVVANCRAAGIPFRTVPGIGELLQDRNFTKQIREVSVNDLLGREPVQVSEDAIGKQIAGKNVMVTGGCGSIGSELCRQLARFNPGRLVVFDQAESEMFLLALELRKNYPSLHLVTEVGDIVCYRRICQAMARNGVEAVFHAAAYKHVPLMEEHIVEAAENNVIGTWNVARAAYENGVGNLLMISSDKAVNPTSIMGVTKRIGELIVSSMPLTGSKPRGAFVSVRFGNVLASNGSVVTIFRKQIAAGGPVTVTHPEMRRYFMSIPEAVLLVLQAFSMGEGGEVFMLDMGNPVRITELATNMIQLAGLAPGEDIRIEYTGLRPGEKLFEELSMDSEDMLPTYHQKVKIFRSFRPDRHAIGSWLRELQILINEGDPEEVKMHMLELVPEYIGDRSRFTAAPPALAAVRNAHA